MYHNPALLQALASERVAALRSSSEPVVRRGRGRRAGIVADARRAVGWLLVDVGLRLAVSPRPMPVRVARRKDQPT